MVNRIRRRNVLTSYTVQVWCVCICASCGKSVWQSMIRHKQKCAENYHIGVFYYKAWMSEKIKQIHRFSAVVLENSLCPPWSLNLKPLSLSLNIKADEADENLFNSIRYNPSHLLHQLLHRRTESSYSLRSRPHNFELSHIHDGRNFIDRMLFYPYHNA